MESIPLLTVQEYVEFNMSGSTGERSFAAQENVLLLILLPVSDTGLFIALLYPPYSLQVGYLSARV